MIEISEKEFLSGKHDTLILNELAKDNLVIFPSESAYGFAGHANKTTVCEKIHKAKKEEHTKPVGLIVDDARKIEDHLYFGEKGKELLKNKFNAPLTVLFKKKTNHPSTSNNYLGIRIPLNKTALKLCSFCDHALTATSANLHGNPAIYSPNEIKKYFGKTDFVFINGGELKTKAPSTYYHFEEGTILRAGEISLTEIEKVLK